MAAMLYVFVRGSRRITCETRLSADGTGYDLVIAEDGVERVDHYATMDRLLAREHDDLVAAMLPQRERVCMRVDLAAALSGRRKSETPQPSATIHASNGTNLCKVASTTLTVVQSGYSYSWSSSNGDYSGFSQSLTVYDPETYTAAVSNSCGTTYASINIVRSGSGCINFRVAFDGQNSTPPIEDADLPTVKEMTAYPNPATDTLDVFRFGGTLDQWYYVLSIPNSATPSFNDDLDDTYYEKRNQDA